MITLPRFVYRAPASVRDACAMLADAGEGGRAMAGGTDVILKLRRGLLAVDTLVALQRIEGLDRLSVGATDGLTIGATALLADVAANPSVRQVYPAVAFAALQTATPQIRNVATVVGNICNASPCADNAPALIALDAEATIAGSDGVRRMPLADVFTGPGETCLARDEIMTAIHVAAPAAGTGVAYRNLSPGGPVGITSVGVAAMLRLAGDTCAQARIVLGAVGPTPLRAEAAEQLLVGRSIGPSSIAEAGEAAATASAPITDVRATAEYRRSMVEVLTRRALVEAERQARL